MGKTDPGGWSHPKYCTCMHELHLGWSVFFSFEMVLVHGGLSRMEWMDGALHQDGIMSCCVLSEMEYIGGQYLF
jgi:hypothetical protein